MHQPMSDIIAACLLILTTALTDGELEERELFDRTITVCDELLKLVSREFCDQQKLSLMQNEVVGHG